MFSLMSSFTVGRAGPPDTPVALETEFGWVLSGSTDHNTGGQVNLQAMTFHSMTTSLSGDDILHQFWEIEEPPLNFPMLGLVECIVMQHFKAHCSRTHEGRFVVFLPKKPDAGIIGELRSQAVHHFTSLERSLTRKGCCHLYLFPNWLLPKNTG